jgi:hypothetical protein
MPDIRRFPAKSITDAFTLLSGVDTNLRLLILGGSQSGAEALVAFCRQKHKDLRIMRLCEDGDISIDPASRGDHERRKPAAMNAGGRSELLYTVYCLLAPDPAI